MNVPWRRVVPIIVLAACALALAGVVPGGPSAAPVPPFAPADGKAGVASAFYLDHNPAKLAALGATWAYDWSAKVPRRDPSLEWVPMIWSERYLTTRNIAALKQARRNGRIRYLLGFNEPDNPHQANMSPERAADMWPLLEQTGLSLGSPAPETPTDGWLARFMRLARQRHLRVNFIALHYYMDFSDPAWSVAALRQQLIQVHDTYHLPIWITELGALDISQWGQTMQRLPSTPEARTYMREVFGMLNALPFVKRYAWYTDSCAQQSGCRYSSLFSTSGAVTPEGREFKRDA